MNVVFCADGTYLALLPTVLNSISASNDASKMRFHLLHNIEDDELIEKFNIYIRERFKTELLSYFVPKRFKYDNNLNHVTDATMLRLLIPNVIDAQGKILYLDADIIVNTNLSRLLTINLSEKGFGGKTSLHSGVVKDMTFGNIKPTYKTLNAGVLIMDLDILRKDKFTEKCLALLDKYPYNDQVIINLYLEGDYSELPKQYNIFNTQDDELLLEHKEYILHYVGAYKPWNHEVPNAVIWKRFEILA
ncbi:MAG: hypothetical protein US60_C0056G0004 [Microgenomates group bacterium GW2011_GWC1_37_8]|uniref:Glycosyl transferase family 8 C-terminal domain-containing protein n=1 Tax=Candidatus Zambryskibacteria bacterium RIFCSPHIGHO2_01_FULL_46_25 TaxID=1802738 RepID=A0A1G2SZB7_9BACT|nr:MAG: hypothetical protein US60_C0056G0004 [Microgenomates group bacterium GW2011_GWC1_37_8]OHA90390.1 MAG: hypothetical protein A2838_02215 [Candidatus Zambryskibacteria bacterium RIFCSPHIGHO2_01_FULL_46_25]OHB06927.1 MAG: hypothetical protein A3A31_01350 [Candidatus Zambryskibacteria bacterium RIFCSPLOWO2_01_FULL_48_25]